MPRVQQGIQWIGTWVNTSCWSSHLHSDRGIHSHAHSSCEYRQITDKDWQPPSNCFHFLMGFPVARIECVLFATCYPRGILYMRPFHVCLLLSFFRPRSTLAFIHICKRLTFASEHPNFKLYRIATSFLPNSSQSSALSHDAL